MNRVALVRSIGKSHHPDLPLLLKAVREVGIEAEEVRWDDPDIAWDLYALAIVHSMDDPGRREEFLAWAAGIPRLANTAAVLRWNTDMSYLRDFIKAGVPVVPAHFIGPRDPVEIPFDGVIIVGPSVLGGSSLDRQRVFGDREAAATRVRLLQEAGHGAIVRPYVHALETRGETALVYFEGAYSHAMRQEPWSSDVSSCPIVVLGRQGPPCEPTAMERRLADAIISKAPRGLLYARVNLVDDRLTDFEAAAPWG